MNAMENETRTILLADTTLRIIGIRFRVWSFVATREARQTILNRPKRPRIENLLSETLRITANTMDITTARPSKTRQTLLVYPWIP
jgi:hypothetical protein